MKRLFLGLSFLLTVCILLNAAEKNTTLTVQEIVTKANLVAYYAGDDGRSVVNMTIIDSQGRQRTREFVVLRKNVEEGGNQFFYVYFRRPGDVRDMVYRVWKNVDGDDDRWVYMKSLDLVNRIAAGDKRTSFVGSDFVYEDVSGRNLNEDHHELIEHKDGYYKLKNTPVNPATVEFTHYYMWINDETFVPERAEYYKGDRKYRIVRAEKIETIDGFVTVTESVVENLENNSKTINSFSDVSYNIGLPENLFTSDRFLRRPPRQWIR